MIRYSVALRIAADPAGSIANTKTIILNFHFQRFAPIPVYDLTKNPRDRSVEPNRLRIQVGFNAGYSLLAAEAFYIWTTSRYNQPAFVWPPMLTGEMWELMTDCRVGCQAGSALQDSSQRSATTVGEL